MFVASTRSRGGVGECESINGADVFCRLGDAAGDDQLCLFRDRSRSWVVAPRSSLAANEPEPSCRAHSITTNRALPHLVKKTRWRVFVGDEFETTDVSVTMCRNFPVALCEMMLTAVRNGGAGAKATKRIKSLSRAAALLSASCDESQDELSPEGFSFVTHDDVDDLLDDYELEGNTRLDVDDLRFWHSTCSLIALRNSATTTMTTSRPNESELSAEVTAVHEANPVRMNWGGVVSPAAHLTLYLYCDTTTLPGTMVRGGFR